MPADCVIFTHCAPKMSSVTFSSMFIYQPTTSHYYNWKW